MGRLQLDTTQAFQMAVAADVLSLINLKTKLEKIDPKPGSAHGDLAHCIGGVLANLHICDTKNMELIAAQLEGYGMRISGKDQGVDENLRATPILDKIRSTIEKFAPVMA